MSRTRAARQGKSSPNKPSELATLATEGVAGYQFWKGTNRQLVAATEYVTVNDLLTDAGITFARSRHRDCRRC